MKLPIRRQTERVGIPYADFAGSNSTIPFGGAMKTEITPEPRWTSLVAMLAAGCVYWALPEPLSVGPSWGLAAVLLVLLVPIVVTYRRGVHRISRVLTLVANGAITLAMIGSLVFLIQGIPHHREDPRVLLRSAVALWFTNVLVFALWYWKLDGGGPTVRETRQSRLESSFLFPQVAVADADPSWTPHFVDYLFLAFNTSTAFSPTDTAVLSRWAKITTMVQSLISLTIVVLLAARAVNIL